MTQKTLIRIKIRDTDTTIFDSNADRISSYNEMGPFDVYPMHANFISIISKEIKVFLDHKVIKELKIERAVMKVKQDEAHIFLGIEALLLEEESSFKKFKE